VLVEVGKTQWTGVGDEQTENAVPFRQLADRSSRLVDTDRDELDERRTLGVQNAKSGIASVDDGGGRFDDRRRVTPRSRSEPTATTYRGVGAGSRARRTDSTPRAGIYWCNSARQARGQSLRGRRPQFGPLLRC
jgi:hypothetical protein